MTMSYGDRGRAAPLNHSVYELYCKSLGLNDADFLNLKNRGLHPEAISTCGYASKLANNNGRTIEAIGKTRQNYDLKGVPGFYTNEKTGHWTQSGITGITIPVRDINGHISSLLIRNAKPTERNGKVINKYVAFSSAGKTDGAKVWQTTHCPIVKGSAKDACGVTARITEGVLKADVATAMDDMFCLGMQGLNFQPDLQGITEELEISTLHIALDSGEDDNIDIIRAKGNLAKLCDDIGIDYKFELWDPKYGKGIDDVLAAGHRGKIRIATQEEVDEILAKAHAKNPNNGEFVYVVGQERFISTIDYMTLKKAQFMDMFQLEKPEVVNLLISKGFTQVSNLTFYPQKDKIVEENDRQFLNLWRDPCIKPMEGDVIPFMNHIDYLYPDKKQKDILLNFLAFNVQNPGHKLQYTLLFQGKQGIGKSFLAQVMRKNLGENNVALPSNEALHQPYTGWMKSASLAIIEEVMARGRVDLMNKLKPMITEPYATIRQMHKEEYVQPNRINFLMFTNHPDPIVIDSDDRRYAVIKSDAKRQEEAYYQNLWSWMNQPETTSYLNHYFLNRDLKDFNPHAKAPETFAKKELVKLSRTRIEEYVQDGIEEKRWPFQGDIVSITHLMDEEVCPNSLQRVSAKQWSFALKKAGALPYEKQIPMNDGSKARVWILRRHEMYVNLEPKEIAKLYEKWLQSNNSNVNPLEDSKPV